MSELHLFFIDELTVADPDDVLTFGRSGDIEVDEANQFMHRVVGAFFSKDNVWWLANKSRHGHLTMVGSTGRVTRLPPDAVAALSEPSGLVRFEAGPSSYELGWTRPGHDPLMPPVVEGDVDEGDTNLTRQFGVVNLNDEQRQMVVALAENRLEDVSADPADLPANAAVAHRLGWSGKKLDRKLDYLCARLASEGVRGLRGEKGFEAVDRRARLVDHAIGSGMVSVADLDALP